MTPVGAGRSHAVDVECLIVSALVSAHRRERNPTVRRILFGRLQKAQGRVAAVDCGGLQQAAHLDCLFGRHLDVLQGRPIVNPPVQFRQIARSILALGFRP